MSRILILGGYGYTGKLLARHLLEQTSAEVMLAGRHTEKAIDYANQLNKEFTGDRVQGTFVDAASRLTLDAALADVQLILVAAPTAQYAGTLIQAALDSGTDYLDIQMASRKLTLLQSFAPQIEEAGLCFITEAGFHPGLPSGLVRYAADQFDSIDTAVTACYLNMGKDLPYSEAVDELMQVFRDYQAQVYKNGTWGESGKLEIRDVDFGLDIGVKKCYSMFFEELRDLPGMHPDLHELGFYMSQTHWMVDWIITPVVFAGLKLAPRRGIRPLGKLMWWAMQTFPRPPHKVVLKVEANGRKNGQQIGLETTLSHPDGYELTAIPVVACLMQYLDETARRPGLWMMGHLVDPNRLFKDMQMMGVQIQSSLGGNSRILHDRSED